MVVLSVALRYLQESRADAAAKLKAMIHVTTTVVRMGPPRKCPPLRDLVPGDIIKLSAGDNDPG
jgi:Mg2+-importing ATPase